MLKEFVSRIVMRIKTNKKIKEIKDALIGLFYPRICACCTRFLFSHEIVVCMHCENHLPITGFMNWPGNPTEKIFWGRVKLKAAAGLYFFDKGEKVQKLMHGLKYKKRKDVGLWLGKKLGVSLLKSGRFDSIDYVVPIPLHPKKEFQRGFNQSLLIGQGIESTTGWVLSELLERTVNTATQTRKTKYERWKNVSGKFQLKAGSDIKGQNILIVDDIVTTGATLEATSRVLLESGAKSVSVATIAVA